MGDALQEGVSLHKEGVRARVRGSLHRVVVTWNGDEVYEAVNVPVLMAKPGSCFLTKQSRPNTTIWTKSYHLDKSFSGQNTGCPLVERFGKGLVGRFATVDRPGTHWKPAARCSPLEPWKARIGD